MPATEASARTNRILGSLPPADLVRLRPDLEPLAIRLRTTLFEPGGRIDYVYFPLSGVVSTLILMENGDAVEFATVGFEGCINFSALFGTDEAWAKGRDPVSRRGPPHAGGTLPVAPRA